MCDDCKYALDTVEYRSEQLECFDTMAPLRMAHDNNNCTVMDAMTLSGKLWNRQAKVRT